MENSINKMIAQFNDDRPEWLPIVLPGLNALREKGLDMKLWPKVQDKYDTSDGALPVGCDRINQLLEGIREEDIF